MYQSRLNIFQRVIRQWDRVHPYNAAQVMTLRGPIAAARASEAWRRTVHELELGPISIDGRTYRFQPPAGLDQVSEPKILPDAQAISAHLTGELNRRFDAGDMPLRPFIVQSPDMLHAGLVYQHWIGDSVSIQQIMRHWLLRIAGHTGDTGTRLHPPAGGYWRHVGPRSAGWSLLGALARSATDFFRYRRVRKIRTAGSLDQRVQVLLQAAPDGWVEAVVAHARAKQVTLTELFLSALADVCQRHVPFQQHTDRHDLAVGAIVDLRSMARDPSEDCFGLFLGFANVICREADLQNEPRRLVVIARQMRLNKQHRTAAASQIWMAAALTARWFRPLEKINQYHRKYMPLAGGISNVNMNRTWAGELHPDPLLRYARISPTGPMVPLVLTTTTLGGRLELAITFRAAVIDAAAAQRVVDEFFSRLAAQAGLPPGPPRHPVDAPAAGSSSEMTYRT
jgi:hypothetical protein